MIKDRKEIFKSKAIRKERILLQKRRIRYLREISGILEAPPLFKETLKTSLSPLS